jgi:hypothetical protein
MLSTELWLVPNGAKPPVADSQFNLIPKLPIKFDVMFPDCPSEMWVYLEESDDSLRYYARALIANPNTAAQIVAYPGRPGSVARFTSVARVKDLAIHTRAALIKKYHIEGRRIVTGARRQRRNRSQVELWLTPPR